MRSVLLASLRTHTRRYVAAALAVTIGVAFIVVTAALSSAARDGLVAGVAAPYAGSDVVASGIEGQGADALVRAAARFGAEASVLGWAYEQVARDGIVLERSTDIAPITTSAALRWPVLEAGAFPTGAGEAAVDVNAAKQADLVLGDRLQIGTGARQVDVRVVGLVDSPSSLVSASLFLTWPDLAGFADRMYVDSVAWAGTGSVGDQKAAIKGVFAGATVQPTDSFVEAKQTEVSNGVDVLATVLLLFAAIALFVSVLVIANTFSILFAQRQRDFALLRCVGATRRQVLRSVRLEAVVLGLASSLLGLVIGTGAGIGVVVLVDEIVPSADLGEASVSPTWYAAGLTVGLLVTLVASWLPTRRAVSVNPLAALRPETGLDIRTPTGRWRIALGVAAVVAGVVLLGVSMATQTAVVMVAGGAATFGGVLLLGPVLVPALIRAAGTLVGRALGRPGRLATGNAVRNPRRTAATAASLLVGVTLTTAVLTGMASARVAVDDEMDLQHPLDLTLTSTGETLPDDLLSRVTANDAVASAVALPGTTGTVAGVGQIELLGAIDTDDVPRAQAGVLDPGAGEVYVPWELLGEAVAGDRVAVTVGDRTQRLRIVGGEGWGTAAVVTPGTLDRLTDATSTKAVWIRAAGGADPEDLAGDVEALGTPYDAAVENGLANRAYVDLQLDVLTGAVVELLGIAVVIALIGIGNTLGLSVLERAREHALLRALGLTRAQLRMTLGIEAVLLSVVATLLGTTLGVAFAWVGVQTMVRSVIEEAPTILPVGQLGLVVLVAGAAGLLSCLLPARRAARIPPAAGLALD